MPSLIKILAASVGGGLILGAAIRLGEVIAAQSPGSQPDGGDPLSTRLGELENRLQESVTARMATMEARLRQESEHSQKQMLDVFADGVQTRVLQRISKLEEEVAGQSAAVSELRECSLRTERSIQKLLSGLDRLIPGNSPSTEPRL